MRSIRKAFKKIGINITPGGVWQFKEGSKDAVDANRKDGLSWKGYKSDNMAKYRPELSDHYVLDLDDMAAAKKYIPSHLWDKAMKTFRYNTTKKTKMHCVFKYTGADLPKRRSNHFVPFDLLPSGNVFTAHVLKDPASNFELFDDEVLELTGSEAEELEEAFQVAYEELVPEKDRAEDAKSSNWAKRFYPGDHIPTGQTLTLAEISAGSIEIGTRALPCPFGADHTNGGIDYAFITHGNGIACNSCQEIMVMEQGGSLDGETLEQPVTNLKTRLTLKSYSDLSDEKTETLVLCGVPYPKQGLTMLTGDGGVGKSYIVIKQAISYLEQCPDEQVLFWFTEDYEAIVRERIESSKASKGVFERMQFITDDINSVEDPLKALKKLSTKFGLIILDPLISFFTGEENSNSEARFFGNRLKLLHGLVILIHHSSKSGAASRGASDFRNMVRLVYEVKKPMTAFHASSFVRWVEDEFKLGKRALLINKDNWGITNEVPKDCRSAESVGFILDVFDISEEYKRGVELSAEAANAELIKLTATDKNRNPRIIEENIIVELAHYQNRGGLDGDPIA